MRHIIPERNWHMELANTIDNAQDGDTIVVHDEDMERLALRAKSRMCPNRELNFEIVSSLHES